MVESTSAALLLEQYNDQRIEKDKKLEYIERVGTKKVDTEKRASWRRGSLDGGNNDWKTLYDDMFQDNLKINLQLREKEKEIDTLKKIIQTLSGRCMENIKGAKPEEYTLDNLKKLVVELENIKQEQQFKLPPRSTERANGTKKTDILEDFENEMRMKKGAETPRSLQSNNGSMKSNISKPQTIESNSASASYANKISISPIRITEPPQNFTSPATSVTYTTSRITIASPKSLRTNNNHSHNNLSNPSDSIADSPLKKKVSEGMKRREPSIDNDLDLSSKSTMGKETQQTEQKKLNNAGPDTPRSPPKPKFGVQGGPDFSPSSKQKIDHFTELLDASFGEEDRIRNRQLQAGLSSRSMEDNTPSDRPRHIAHPTLNLSANSISTPASLHQLGSPIIVNKKIEASGGKESLSSTPGTSSIVSSIVNNKVASSSPIKNITNTSDHKSEIPIIISPDNNTTNNGSHTSELGVPGRKRGNSTSSVRSSASALVSDIPLFVQPEDLGTIKINVLSTLYHDPDNSFHGEDNLVLFSVIDRKSSQEMFKFSKCVRKLKELDVYLKSHAPSVSLPELPNDQLHKSLLPIKVDYRRERLNQYFASIVSIPKFPPNVSLKIAQFISTDTVMTPLAFGDALYEGRLIMRKPKALGGGNTWKLRYGVLNSDTLQLLENDQNAEQIRMRQVSLEILPNLPDDKFGTRNGFLLTEHKKSGLSASNKYYLCTETAKEREGWISSLHQLLEPNSNTLHTSTSSIRSTSNTIDSTSSSRLDSSKNDSHYVTDLSQNNSTEVISTHSNISSPAVVPENNDDDKESRRMKMRSIFPFKKIAGGVFPHEDDKENDAESINRSVETFVTTNTDGGYQRNIESNTPVPVNRNAIFGATLQHCVKLSSKTYQRNYHLPSIVYRCLEYLYKNHGIQEEGIFRLSGSSTLIKQLQERFDREYDVDLADFNNKIDGGNGTDENLSGQYISVNTVSGLLKLYLRQLPHLICGDDQYPLFKRVVDENHDNPSRTAIGFRAIVSSGSIAHENMSLMYALFELLQRIHENKRFNKMNLKNLCIVFSPTLNISANVLQPFIVDFACIFKGEEPINDSLREEVDIHIPQI
ncbi:GTPase-activating protein BEM3 [Nakaseomyces bracarensis]|uniref:GTPase-activating protein BEM3 n=1 Tax=Nakaseomyces bracarensis TaxID=273131 RepID=A0ABR4NUE9_9SACH